MLGPVSHFTFRRSVVGLGVHAQPSRIVPLDADLASGYNAGMGTENWAFPQAPPGLSVALRSRLGRILSTGLVVAGVFLLLAAAAYAAYARLNNWLMEQEYYLIAGEVAPLSVPSRLWIPSPTPSATVGPAGSLAAEAVPAQPKIQRKIKTPTPIPSAMVVLPPAATLAPALIPIVTPLPTATAVPTSRPTSLPSSPPVKIRIPALRVTRSIIHLARVRDRSSGAWTWNTDRLFRSGRMDLVGHSEGAANPGQEGNMILVGHNYGIGYSGVFVGLRRLKPGDKVQVVSKAGETFTYRVKTVQRVKWQRKNFGELTQHLNFLAVGGQERLTLVSCTGADFEPFPERIYVVAEPVR